MVDFSSGSNEFVAMLKRKCIASGDALANTCSFVGFDIVPGKFHEDFVKSNWFKVQMTDVRSSPPRSLLLVRTLAPRPTQLSLVLLRGPPPWLPRSYSVAQNRAGYGPLPSYVLLTKADNSHMSSCWQCF